MGNQGKTTTNFKLKGIRVAHNYTQQEIANELGVSKATYARKENGLGSFNSREITILLKLLNTSYEEVFG